MKNLITYHDNGNKCEEGYYKDGKREGECTSWYANGEQELLGYFKNLLKQGHLVSNQRTMLVIMENALQPTQRLFMITIVESEIFLSFL